VTGSLSQQKPIRTIYFPVSSLVFSHFTRYQFPAKLKKKRKKKGVGHAIHKQDTSQHNSIGQ